MTVILDQGFENGDLLRDIRKDLLNPIAVKVASLEKGTDSTDKIAKHAFFGVVSPPGKQELHFKRYDGEDDGVANLAGMFPNTSAMTVKGGKSGTIKDPTALDFKDATLDNTGLITYDWSDLVTTNQDHVFVGKTGSTGGQQSKAIYFKGKNITVDYTTGIATISVDEPPTQIMGQVGTGVSGPVSKIFVEGDVANSSLLDGNLTIQIPTGGGGGAGPSDNNFKGFFATLGDIISQVTSPINGKSYAFAKDSKIGGNYYTPYFYVNSTWTELKQDPALTYSATTAPETQGVFSIKPDPRITIDSTGQLNLSDLGLDDSKINFHGFFTTQPELEAAVPTPVAERSFAYIKHTNGAWIGKMYGRQNDGSNAWTVVAPISALSLLEKPGTSNNPAPVYGIYNNGQWEMDTNGIASLKLPKPEIPVEITGALGKTGTYDSVQYVCGSNVTLDNKKLTIQHPQRVITYNSTFENSHNSKDYEGNIYYDETSRCWMGWGVPEASGGVDVKWTRIAHPKMSDEVKDLNKRMPRKAPYVTPGILGDAPSWEYTGWTYVRKDDLQLPQDFRERCGAYFITVIQDVEGDTPRPQERYQICYADEEGATSYVRKWLRTGSTGDYGWQPWVKISMSAKDINDHNTSHTAHRDIFKFYKVGTLDMSWATLKSKNWVVGDSDLLLLADSDGVSLDGESTIKTPYTGTYRFSGRIDFDGWSAKGPYQKPTFIIYVYKTSGAQSSIISEHSYEHKSTATFPPPLQWKSGEIALSEGDRIHFEIKAFGGSLDTNYPSLRFIPNRTFFVMEDFKTTAGSRIAETFRRTIGSLNAHYNVGVNVHYNEGTTGAIRVYGGAVTAQATNMTKVKR